MTLAIFDTNFLIQAVIGSPWRASARAVRAYRNGKCRLLFSPETLEELQAVLILPSIRLRHGWSDHDIEDYVRFLLADSLFLTNVPALARHPARDVTDTKLLELADAGRSEFLVSNDRRDLLPLKQFGTTAIVTPAQFLRSLP